jgi:hypothetical protein
MAKISLEQSNVVWRQSFYDEIVNTQDLSTAHCTHCTCRSLGTKFRHLWLEHVRSATCGSSSSNFLYHFSPNAFQVSEEEVK